MSKQIRPTAASQEWAASKDELVWLVCRYLRVHTDSGCVKCPSEQNHPEYGPCKIGCRALAEECAAVVRDEVLKEDAGW